MMYGIVTVIILFLIGLALYKDSKKSVQKLPLWKNRLEQYFSRQELDNYPNN